MPSAPHIYHLLMMNRVEFMVDKKIIYL